MAAVEDLMAEGMAANIAKQLGLEAAVTGLTATGSTQVDALALTSTFSIFGTVAASTGCVAGTKNSVIVNGGVSALSVYPPLGWAINGGTINAAISVPAGKSIMIIPARGLNMAAIVSA